MQLTVRPLTKLTVTATLYIRSSARDLDRQSVDYKCDGRSKTHKRLKERFLIRRNRTKRENYRGKPLFQATYNNTTENS